MWWKYKRFFHSCDSHFPEASGSRVAAGWSCIQLFWSHVWFLFKPVRELWWCFWCRKQLVCSSWTHCNYKCWLQFMRYTKLKLVQSWSKSSRHEGCSGQLVLVSESCWLTVWLLMQFVLLMNWSRGVPVTQPSLTHINGCVLITGRIKYNTWVFYNTLRDNAAQIRLKCGSNLICKATTWVAVLQIKSSDSICVAHDLIQALQKESDVGGDSEIWISLNHLFLFFFSLRIPLKKFRSIRRELTDSGRRAEELLADKHSLKYNFGFPSSKEPTPETLKNYLDVSIISRPLTCGLFTFPNILRG